MVIIILSETDKIINIKKDERKKQKTNKRIEILNKI